MSSTRASMPHVEANVGGLPPDQLEVLLYAGTVQVVDVREAEELIAHGWIAGAVHLPLPTLEAWADHTGPSLLPRLVPARTTVTCCDSGGRSAVAASLLRSLGFSDVVPLAGGVDAWTAAGHPVVGLAPWQA